MNLYNYFLGGKQSYVPALLTHASVHTYGDVRRAASHVAAFIIASGGTHGDRVLILAEPGFFWVVAYLGVLRAGLVAVPVPATISPADLGSIVGSAEPRFAFVQSRSVAQHSSALRHALVVVDNDKAGLGLPDFAAICHHTYPEVAPVDVAPDAVVALMFTSGSTAHPRGVMVTVKNIIANTESIVSYLRLTSSDRILAVLPFHYCFGASLLHTHLRAGGSVVIEPSFLYVEKVLERLSETQCTGFAGVPSHFQILLRRSNLARRHFPHLRYVQQAGGHLAPTFIESLREALPATEIFVMYGQTEATARLSYLPPDRVITKAGSVGIPIPGVKLAIVDEYGNSLPPGAAGEIVAEGDNITAGYWGDEFETARKFRDGKLYTGDIARVDDDGFIYIVDRAGDFLKCGGKRTSCRSVEDVLLQCDLLVEAAVFGVPDETLGEAVKAVVVPRHRTSQITGQVHDFCRTHLAQPLVPKYITVADSLPKNSSGKVLKLVLRQEHAADAAAARHC